MFLELFWGVRPVACPWKDQSSSHNIYTNTSPAKTLHNTTAVPAQGPEWDIG